MGQDEKDLPRDFLVEDDASRYLKSIDPADFEPKYQDNKLPEVSGEYTNEEKELAWKVMFPNSARFSALKDHRD